MVRELDFRSQSLYSVKTPPLPSVFVPHSLPSYIKHNSIIPTFVLGLWNFFRVDFSLLLSTVSMNL